MNIPKPNGRSEVIKRFGDTSDIIDVLLKSDKDKNWQNQTKAFSKQFPKTRKGLEKLAKWILDNVEFRIDPNGVQWIKSPARTVDDEFADCKSLTLLQSSVWRNMGLRYRIRFVGYGRQQQVSHVYGLVYLNGEWIAVDTVWMLPKHGGKFGTEKKFSIKRDYERKD